MTTVWIVYHDESPDGNILGVFDDESEAYLYQESVSHLYANGTLLTPFPVPWRATDQGQRVVSSD